MRKCSRSIVVAGLELICFGALPLPVLSSDHAFRRIVTRLEPEMDFTAAFAFLDSDSEDEAPPFVAPDFFEEDGDETDNMVQLFGLAANYSADF